MEYLYIIIAAVFTCCLYFVYWFTTPFRALKSRSPSSTSYSPVSKYLEINTKNDTKVLFERSPKIEENPSQHISLIVPAYNEEKRIGQMLNDYIDFLKSKEKPFEVIVVDDGSSDKTINTALEIGREKNCNLKVIKSPCNGGKGLAVKVGILQASGDYILFADADNATKAECIEDLYNKIEAITCEGKGVAIGSRNHSNKEVVKQRNFLRNFLSLAANSFLKCIFATSINVCYMKDTQCGFKMFTRKAARLLFRTQHLERWAFDLEIIYLCSKLNIPVEEVPVHWVEIPGSKFSVIKDLINMFRDALLVRILYMLNVWTIDDVTCI